MNGTVPPSSSNSITAASPLSGTFRSRAICISIWGERDFGSDIRRMRFHGRRKQEVLWLASSRPQRSGDDGEYTFVTPERQNELTRRIQDKLSEAAKSPEMRAAVIAPPSLTAPQVLR